MPMVIAYHEIDDSEHWLASPRREEVFGPLGISVRTFLDPGTRTARRCSPTFPTWPRFRR